MQIDYKQMLKTTLSDRTYLAVIVGMVVMALVATLYIILTVETRDIQVTTRFASFGETNYYKGKWYELYQFALLAIAIAGAHSALMLKFRALNHRNFGIVFGLATMLIILVGLVYVSNVIHQLAFI